MSYYNYITGIMQLIKECAPKNAALVQGSSENLQLLRSKIKQQTKTDCNIVSNGYTFIIETLIKIPTEEQLNLLKMGIFTCHARGPKPNRIHRSTIFTIHVAEQRRIVMMNLVEACKEVHAMQETLKFCANYKFEDQNSNSNSADKLLIMFKEKLNGWNISMDQSSNINVESVKMEIVPDEKQSSQKLISVSWSNRDEDLALYILEVLDSLS